MSGGGKKKGKRKKNTTVAATKKSFEKDKVIMPLIHIVSVAIIVLFIIFPDFLRGRIISNVVVVGCALFNAIPNITQILQRLKERDKEKHKIIKSIFLCAAYVLLSAQAVMGINNVGENGANIKTIKVVKVEEEPSEVTFVINFSDPLFSNNTPEDLEKNKESLTTQVINAVKNGNAVSLKISDNNYILYEECVMQAQDYENVYDKCTESHIFEKYNKNELVSFLDSAIACRKDGDKAYSTYENRRCVALRYNDKGYELCRNENVNESLAAYKSAIEYGVGALCVQFKSKNKWNSDTKKIVDAILRGYKGVTELTTEDNGNYKKAIVLIEIFEKIKEEL